MTFSGSPAESWDSGNGLAGYVWRSADSRGSLLLQHGYAEYAERYVTGYNRLVPNLLNMGYDVYAFDLRGHGRSPGARAVTDLRAAVSDHQAARRQLSQIGKPLVLFGHSLGGLVTAGSVVEDACAVNAVVLSSPALLIKSNALTRALASIVAKVAPGADAAPQQDASGLSRLPEEVQRFESDPRIIQRGVPVKLGASAIAVARDVWAGSGNWHVPTFIMHGTSDTFTDPAGSRLFTAMIGTADKELLSVEDGRHELLNDLDRDDVLSRLLVWLRPHLLATLPRDWQKHMNGDLQS